MKILLSQLINRRSLSVVGGGCIQLKSIEKYLCCVFFFCDDIVVWSFMYLHYNMHQLNCVLLNDKILYD